MTSTENKQEFKIHIWYCKSKGMNLTSTPTPTGFPHLSYHEVAWIPERSKPLRFQLGKMQHPRFGQPPASSPLLPSLWIIYSKTCYKYPLSEIPRSSGTHSPPLAACALLKQCQLAISLQSEPTLLTQH